MKSYCGIQLRFGLLTALLLVLFQCVSIEGVYAITKPISSEADSLKKELKQFYRENDLEKLDSMYVIYKEVFQDGLIDSANFREGIVYISYPFVRASEFVKAKKFLDEGHKFYNPKQRNIELTVTYIEGQLGNIYSRLGDYMKAQYLLKLKYDMLVDRGEIEKSLVSLNNLALAYYYNNDIDTAIALYEKSVSESSRLGLASRQVFALEKIAELYCGIKNYNKARYYIDELKRVEKDITSEGEMIHYIRALASLYSHTDEHEKAVDALKNILKSSEINNYENNRPAAKICNKIVESYLSLGQLDSTLVYINKSLSYISDYLDFSVLKPEQTFPENIFSELGQYYAHYCLKKYLITHDEVFLDRGLKSLDLSESVLERLSSEYVIEDQKLISMASINSINNLRIRCLEKKYASSMSSIDEIDSFFVDAKMGLMSKVIQESQSYMNLPAAVKEEISFLRLRVEELRRAYKGDSDKSYLDSILLYNERLRDLELFNIDSDISYISSPYIDYYISDKNVYAINGLSNNKSLVILGETENVIMAIEEVIALIKGKAEQSALKSKLNNLYGILLRPFEPLPSSFSVVLHQDLERIPLDVLVDDKGDFIIEEHEIKTRLNRIKLEESFRDDYNMYVAYPEYSLEQSSIHDNSKRLYIPLHNAVKEAESISTLFDYVVLESTITRDRLLDALETSKIFHFAGHAESSPFRGNLILGNDSQNEKIYGNDIAAVKNDNFLVVLSACETGVGEIHKGEGSFSLARAFIEGGAKNVINSLWRVNDASTQSIMEFLYLDLSNGYSPSQSLRNAKLKYLESASDELSHPYYWAGLVNTTMLDEEGNNLYSYTYLIIGVLFLGITIFLTNKYLIK